MKTNNNRARAAVLGCALALLSGSAVATTTVGGGNVSYTFDETALGLFGSASVVDGNLKFAPSGFSTSSYAVETINITVTAASGYSLGGFSLSENGTYTLSGGSAWATGSFKAIDIEGTTGNQITKTFNGVLDGGAWDAAATIALPATGWGGTDGVVSSVTLTLSNQLFATDGASISKTGVSISAAALPVPEASTYAMLLAGLGLVGFMAYRRTHSTL
jgi:hypothetical protein